MILTEKHVIRKNHMHFNECDHLSFLSKNLYNSTLFAVRQHYFNNGEYLNYNNANKIFTIEGQSDYIALPRKVSKHTMMLVDRSFRSFFKLLEKKRSGGYDKTVRIPKYLNKTKGRQVVHYEKGALSFKKKEGHLYLSQTNIYLKTKVNSDQIQFARIVPRDEYYVIEVGYKAHQVDNLHDNGRYLSLDLGVNNLVTAVSNVTAPILFNGRPLKSINQFYNKRFASLQSKLGEEVKSSKQIKFLHQRRLNKINDYLHKTSRMLVNHAVENSINTIVIGYNKEWKQDINIGRRNNQNFASIPFARLIEMIEYKASLVGINTIRQEESYTSKCSFFDDEQVRKANSYAGKRVERGLFKTRQGIFVNADVNGALNILRKALKVSWNDQSWSDCVAACSVPKRVNIPA